MSIIGTTEPNYSRLVTEERRKSLLSAGFDDDLATYLVKRRIVNTTSDAHVLLSDVRQYRTFRAWYSRAGRQRREAREQSKIPIQSPSEEVQPRRMRMLVGAAAVVGSIFAFPLLGELIPYVQNHLHAATIQAQERPVDARYELADKVYEHATP